MELHSPASAKFTLAVARARLRALESGLDLMAQPRNEREWLVPSISRPQLHVVRRERWGWRCDCEASLSHKPCCHVEAVRLRLQREVVCLVERQQNGASANGH